MKNKYKTVIIICCLLVIAAISSWWFFLQNGDDIMITSCARNHTEMEKYQELGDDEYQQTVQPLWNDDLAEDLRLIGGVDHLSWAKICRDDDDPEGIYRGEYRDKLTRYIGTFRYVHPEGKSAPERIFRDFHMALIEDQGIRFHQNSPNPPIEYFHMMPTHPENVQWAEY